MIACDADPVEDETKIPSAWSRSGSMTLQEYPSAKVRRLKQGSLAAMVTIALAAWLGWALRWRPLASTHPLYIPMAPNTALNFLLLALGLGWLSRPGDRSPGARMGVPATCAALASVIALARMFEILAN